MKKKKKTVSVFWDSEGELLVPVNSERFVQTLNKLKEPEDQLTPQPPYSHNLPPAEFHIFFISL